MRQFHIVPGAALELTGDTIQGIPPIRVTVGTFNLKVFCEHYAGSKINHPDNLYFRILERCPLLIYSQNFRMGSGY
jgi:hypothetical protein